MTTSAPRRMPLSSSTAAPPPTASTTSGSASSEAGAPSSWRPPWFETTMPSTPASTASVASSWVRIALDEDAAGTWPSAATRDRARSATSRPSIRCPSAWRRPRSRRGPERGHGHLLGNLEPGAEVALTAAELREVDGEHDCPVALATRPARSCPGRLRGRSTSRAGTSARRPAAAAATSSIVAVASVDKHITVPAAAAPRAIASSPSGCAIRWKAVGATSTGSDTSVPSTVVAASPRRRRRASAASAPSARRPRRFSRIVHSSFAPPAK